MRTFPILLFLFYSFSASTQNRPEVPALAVKGFRQPNSPYLTATIISKSFDELPSEAVPQRTTRVEQGLTTEVLTLAGSKVSTSSILARMKHHRVNGLSIAVINNGVLEWAKGYGITDANQPESITTETLFQTASVGKVITALAALKLVKEGKIGLDEDVNEKLTSWKVPENKYTAKEKVTLRHLLSHSAGLTDDYGFGGYPPGEKLPTTAQILNAQLPANNKKTLVVTAIPGTQMRYSGGGYVIIQQLIEDLTRQTFQAFVEQEIFQRLGLQHSTYDYYPDKNQKKVIARGHNPDGTIDASKKYNVFPESAAAGFWSTPSDLAKILIHVQKEKQGESELILNQTLVEAMLTPQFDSNPRGLGVFLSGAQRAEGFGHAGNNPGYNSLLYATTATGQGAVVMVNSDAGIDLAQEVIRSIANEYNWPFMRTYQVQSLPQEQLKKYVGTYQAKEGLLVKVSESKNGLSAKFNNPKVTLNFYPIADQQFIIKEEPDTLRFTFVWDNASKVIELILEKYAGSKIILKKVK